MYQDFRILSADTDLKTKSIMVTSNFDIDPNTVNNSNVEVYDKVSHNHVDYTFEVLSKSIKLVLTDWPHTNTEYVVSVQNLKTILGDPLNSGMRKVIVFKSSVCSLVNITYPAFNEVIKDLKLKWSETAADTTQPLVNSFYIEISTEPNFFHVIKSTEVQNRNEIDLVDLAQGQYYSRIRAQVNGEYGLWSDVVTFVVGDAAAPPDPVFDPDIDSDGVYVPDIKVVGTPTNGETPTSFFIEFDCNIDPASIGEIVVIRRKI